MYASILPFLRFPHCGSEFELTESEKDSGEIVTGKKIITERIAEPVERDLIPCAGELFANAVLIAE